MCWCSNDEDLTYAKTRLDERSMATVVDHIATIDNSLARAVVWAAAWDMVRDAEMRARDYIQLVVNGLPAETDINLVTATLRQGVGAVIHYADPAWAATGWTMLAGAARDAIAEAKPGSGFQLAWARTFIGSARSDSDLNRVAGWLDGTGVPGGLSIDTELRWAIVGALAAAGRIGEDVINAELDRDRTASGERQAATATALIATAEAKAEVWRRLTEGDALPNWLQRALLVGFQSAAHPELTKPYVAKFFSVIDRIWATQDSEPAHEFVEDAYPSLQIEQSTIDATDAWLAGESHPAPLRRLVTEGRDGLVRALAGRVKDAS